MATLHVRNVPDELYELLRELAARNGRSIGAETVELLHEKLVLGGMRRLALPGMRRRPAGRPGVFTRFTPEARRTVVAAQEEARALHHGHVDTEHLLLGVIAVAPRLLPLGAEDVRGRLAAGDAETTGQIPFTPEAKRALELALRCSVEMGDSLIGPRHMLTGIAKAGGLGGDILRAAAPDTSSPMPEPLPDPAFRVVLLEGEGEDWERQLNDAAELGYDLVEIVDRRAIFRR
jgi:antitoxin FitA-like protein/ClpA/ClpB-like protein